MKEPPSDETQRDSVSTLASIKLFAGLNESALKDLAEEAAWIEVSGGAILFRQGEPGDSLYVVIRGRLHVENDQGTIIGDVARGESVGEMAILTGDPRSATVHAIRDSELLRLSSESFDRLTSKYPQLMRQLTLLIIERLHRTIKSKRPTSQADATAAVAIALVPATSSVPLKLFSNNLLRACQTLGSTLLITKENLYQQLARTRPQGTAELVNNSLIVKWLNEQEEKYDFVVYEGEGLSSAWTGRCMRQADCVLLVASADSLEQLPAIQSELIENHFWETRPHKELALLHSADQAPTATATWLKTLKVTRHHHLHIDAPDDFARLARLVTGRAVGLVLSGGGARGFAHIGIIRALKEANVPIDIIGGSSMGALMSGLYAKFQDPDLMLRATRKAFIEAGSLHDYVFPLVSLVSSMRYTRVFGEMYGDTEIEDLPVKFFCLTTNLTKASVSVHQTGLLRKWTGASARVPGYAPPEFHESDLHVDGGVLNNLPVDVMRRMTPGPIIAVDVSSNSDLSSALNDSKLHGRLLREHRGHVTYFPSPWHFIWERLNPFAQKTRIPLINDILIQTAGLSSDLTESTVRDHADLYLRPPLDDYSLFQYEAIDDLIKTGYEYARGQIQNWVRNP